MEEVCRESSHRRAGDASDDDVLQTERRTPSPRFEVKRRRRSGWTMMAYGMGVGILFALVGSVSGSAIPLGGVHRTGLTSAEWKHKGLVEELQSMARRNLMRVEELSNSAGDLVSEVDKLKKLLLSQSSITEDLPKFEAECPDWVEALGKSVEADTEVDSWIDGSSSTTPSPPGEEMTHGKFKYGETEEEDYYKGHGIRVTEVGPQERRAPFSFRRTVSMADIVVEEQAVTKKPVDELVAFLDLDKCSIYGQDGNDLTIAVQWMQGGMDKLCGLYAKLVNPQLRPLYQQLAMSVESIPVVLYTMRPQLLRYKSAVRGRTMALQWKKEWHHSMDQVVIPPEIEDPEEILATYSGTMPLYPQEQTDLYMSFQRLLAIRKVIKDELHLESNPPIVVSAVMKDVQGTATKLGLPAEKSYLWDDNEVLKGQPHVLTVDPYVAMDRERRDALLEFMERYLPIQSLSQDVVEFMLGAKPDSCSMRIGDQGSREYVVNECPSMPRFPIPDLPLCYSTPKFMALHPEEEIESKKHGTGQYNAAIVEFYTAAWRKGDETARETRRQWVERSEMVW